MLLPQSGCQRQGREKASGQAWRERRRGEAVLPLPQLRLAPLAPLSPSQTGSQNILSLTLLPHFSKYFHSVVNFAFSPSPLVQLAETPDEVVVSKEWLAQCNLSFYSFYVKLVRLAALYNFTFPNPVVTVFYGPTCDSDWFCVVWGSWK